MRRREFLLAAAIPAVAPAVIDTSKVKTRKIGKVEVVYNSPKTQPNGLQVTREGLWIIDQGPGNYAHLVDIQTGKVIKGFETETQQSSGITWDGEALWIGSTYSRDIVRCDANTGKALERHFTPGAGVIYKMVGDPPQRSTPVPPEQRPPRAPAPARGVQPPPAAGRAAQGARGRAGDTGANPGTGAHGQEWRDGKLWFVVPPSRMAYCMDPKTWEVLKSWPVAGNRPHGIAWEGRFLWVTDSNLNAFHKHDPETGQIVEKIQLGDKDPLPHGMSISDGWMYYCDDIGIVCRFKLS